jgi:hypothetical protein
MPASTPQHPSAPLGAPRQALGRSSGAPVCPISRSQAAPGMPGVRAPVIPTATDLPSLVAAVNTINQILQTLLGPGTVTNNVYPPAMPPMGPSGGSSPTSQGKGSRFFSQPDWAEAGMNVERLQIFHKDFSPTSSSASMGVTQDLTQWVNVHRINAIDFEDGNLGGSFLWQYHTP